MVTDLRCFEKLAPDHPNFLNHLICQALVSFVIYIIHYLYTIQNKSANALALCHPPSASFCSVLAVQWGSRIFTHDRYKIPSDILIEFEVNLGIIIEKYA